MRVLLIGDSILMGYSNGPGYHPFVRERLDRQQSSVTAQACSDSGSLSSSLEQCLERQHWDVIHFNCGLHDLKRDRVTGKVISDIEAYTRNLTAICERLCQTNSRVVWATITPVHDEWHRTYKPFDRRQSDVVSYNRAAIEIASRFPISINDLHAVVCALGQERLQFTDGVHFTEAGSRVLADAVLAAVTQDTDACGEVSRHIFGK